MRKNANMFHPILCTAIGCCVAITLASLFFSMRLFYICLGVTAACALLLLWQIASVRRYVNGFLIEISRSLTTAQRDTLATYPMPVFACNAQGEILWCNPLAERDVLGGESFFGRGIQALVPGLDVNRKCPEQGLEVSCNGRNFVAYHLQAASRESELFLVYFFENTELKHDAQEYYETRPSVMIILIDNYEELSQNLKDNERARILGQLEYVVSKYVTDSGALFLRAERDRFMAVIEERHLRDVIYGRFTLLEQVRAVEMEGSVSATLSIGVGRDAGDLIESEQFARQALDMALGRGGDQAAVRSASGYEFFGGVSNGMEKRTKVKTRIVANALAELIAGSDNVIVMGHRLADLDCFGASVALVKAAKLMGKDAYLAIRREHNLVEPLFSRMEENGYHGVFIEPETALTLVSKKTLLIICDTHTPRVLESGELYEACKSVVVIDHHRKMVGHIDNAVIFYHEPYASSASEMVAELVQYFGERYRITRMEAEALLAGIMLDTKNFVIKTGVRTFEAAAYLRKIGADTVEVRKLFASSMQSYQRKAKLVANAQVYKGCAVAVSSGHGDEEDVQITAAQAADELLGITGVQASFLVFETPSGVSFSARSMGQINVQIIMEKLGGGGHLTMAGAQTPNIDTETARTSLLEAIDAYFEENARK